MAENIVLTNLANLQNESTAVTAINSNNAAITTAFTDVVSRSGSSPNSMNANLDMNNNRILNLPAPSSIGEPIRIGDANLLSSSGTIVINNYSGIATTLMNNVQDQLLTGGWNNTTYDYGFTFTVIVDCGKGPLQSVTNNSLLFGGDPMRIGAPLTDGQCVLLITNGTSAGIITPGGFTVSSTFGVGDPFDTVNGHVFAMYIYRIKGVSFYRVQALQ